MDTKYAPWRIHWVTSDDRNADIDGCVFCELPEQDDDIRHRILARGQHSYALLNNSPYNPGHTMVIPFAHTEDFLGVETEALLDLIVMLKKIMGTLSNVYHPDGFNIGANIGTAAGASIGDHLHFHVIPRWNGDTGFMPTTANTKIIVEALDESYVQLRESLEDRNDTRSSSTGEGIRIDTC